MISYGLSRKNIFCFLSQLGWSLHRVAATPSEEALRALGERAEARGRGLPAYKVRFQSKQHTHCLPFPLEGWVRGQKRRIKG